MDRSFEGFETQGKAVALGAALAVALLAYAALRAAPPTVTSVIVALGIAIVALVALTRTPMPSLLRTALMLALIGTVLCLALRAEFMMLTPVRREVDKHLLPPSDGSSYGRSAGKREVTGVPAGAELAVGGLDTRMLGETVGDDIAGASAWRITGEAKPVTGETRTIALTWRVGGGDVQVRCGILSISSRGSPAAYGLLQDRFRRAVRASVKAGRPRCG